MLMNLDFSITSDNRFIIAKKISGSTIQRKLQGDEELPEVTYDREESMFFTTCFECAKYETRKICLLNGRVDDKWTGACCTEDDISPNCAYDDLTNICSGTFED